MRPGGWSGSGCPPAGWPGAGIQVEARAGSRYGTLTRAAHLPGFLAGWDAGREVESCCPAGPAHARRPGSSTGHTGACH